jgi:glycosyltransferase involved in cell wall biosynthesis
VKFLIIIPAHNEEENLFFCLKSIENQLFQDFDLMIVNDGSTDDTQNIIQNFILQSPIKARIQTLNLSSSQHEPGAKVVRTFYKGLEKYNLENYEVVCKWDADIVFPPDYLLSMNKVFIEYPNVGMASGIVKIAKNKEEYHSSLFNFNEDTNWEFENISSKNHVRGPIKAYRKACFLAINGLKPVLGWDNIDVALTQMKGYEIKTEKDLWVKHLRPTAYKYKKQKAEKLGEYFYNLGLNLPLVLVSSCKSAWKNKSLSEIWITLQSYLQQKHKRPLNKEEIQFIRNDRWKKIGNRLGA